MYWSGYVVILLAIFIDGLIAFDMWKIIAESNIRNITRRQSDSGGAILIGGDILSDVVIQHAPTQNKEPIFNWHKKLWITREIPYEITGRLTGSENTEKILQSLNVIEKKSCLKFRRKYPSDKNWILFRQGNGCFASIGRRYWTTGATEISLGGGCVRSPIIIHEVMHSLGFLHEQSRTDRDSYVKIYENRVQPGMFSNFAMNHPADSTYSGTEYDIKSIMQYGKRTFVTSVGGVYKNTIESKFDPNMDIGNSELSKIDIIELNKLYQCHVKSGWGDWSEVSPCFKNWRGECTKARVRICVSRDQSRCSGVNNYGVQEEVYDCTISEYEADSKKVDGIWGQWGAYSYCTGEGDCGWGTITRSRSCNNPAPAYGGKNCAGNSKKKSLCRRRRCSGNAEGDASFDSNFDGWTSYSDSTSLRFNLKKYSGWSNGPTTGDHTKEITGVSNGYYASARGKGEWEAKKVQLRSPTIKSYAGSKCLMFSYMLNGKNLHDVNALSVFVKAGNDYSNLPFVKAGHISNKWQGAALDISGIKRAFQVIFEVQFTTFGESEVAIDDIFFDHKICNKGMYECEDLKNDCVKRAKKGGCNDKNQLREMFGDCCKTCNDPVLGKIKPIECRRNKYSPSSKCDRWAKIGHCQINKWMGTNCCASCKLDTVCSVNNFSPSSKCDKWAEEGYCRTNKWMLTNCCSSCKLNGMCELKTGDGIGGTELKVDHKSSLNECIQACQEKKAAKPNINGVTVSSSRPLVCYCEMGMTDRNNDMKYKSCKLIQSKK